MSQVVAENVRDAGNEFTQRASRASYRIIRHDIATMSEKHAQDLALAQIKVNAAEAASGSLFKGGWRPFVGWVCGVAFCYHFILQPLVIFIVAIVGVDIPDLPEFRMNTLLTVLGGLLGIGGLRTYEKQKGLTK